VQSVPSALIEIDGYVIGHTPIADLPVPRGPRRFVAVFENGWAMERVIEVEGETLSVLFP
jgi:hypothetical protein